MKKAFILFAAFFVFSTSGAFAQGTTNDLETDLGARVNLSVNKKLAKGLHLIAEGEARMSDNLSSFNRYQAGLGLTYKISPMFKVGAGYEFIEKLNSEAVWKPRHRAYLDGSFTLKAGDWNFSLKERLQMTHREVNNVYEHTPDKFELKSRLKVAYKGFGKVTPYAYAELRNVLNDPSVSATWSSLSKAYGNYSFIGYTDAYINRARGSVGLEWKLSKNSALDFYVLTDYCYDKNIDVNSEGTILKSLTYDQTFRTSICLGYQFSF